MEVVEISLPAIGKERMRVVFTGVLFRWPVRFHTGVGPILEHTCS